MTAKRERHTPRYSRRSKVKPGHNARTYHEVLDLTDVFGATNGILQTAQATVAGMTYQDRQQFHSFIY